MFLTSSQFQHTVDRGDFCSHLNQYGPPLSRGVRSHLSLAAKRRAEVQALSCRCALQSAAFHHVLQHLISPFWIQSFTPLTTEFNIFHFWSFLQLFMTIFNSNFACFSGDLPMLAWGSGHFGGGNSQGCDWYEEVADGLLAHLLLCRPMLRGRDTHYPARQ